MPHSVIASLVPASHFPEELLSTTWINSKPVQTKGSEPSSVSFMERTEANRAYLQTVLNQIDAIDIHIGSISSSEIKQARESAKKTLKAYIDFMSSPEFMKYAESEEGVFLQGDTDARKSITLLAAMASGVIAMHSDEIGKLAQLLIADAAGWNKIPHLARDATPEEILPVRNAFSKANQCFKEIYENQSLISYADGKHRLVCMGDLSGDRGTCLRTCIENIVSDYSFIERVLIEMCWGSFIIGNHDSGLNILAKGGKQVGNPMTIEALENLKKNIDFKEFAENTSVIRDLPENKKRTQNIKNLGNYAGLLSTEKGVYMISHTGMRMLKINQNQVIDLSLGTLPEDKDSVDQLEKVFQQLYSYEGPVFQEIDSWTTGSETQYAFGIHADFIEHFANQQGLSKAEALVHLANALNRSPWGQDIFVRTDDNRIGTAHGDSENVQKCNAFFKLKGQFHGHNNESFKGFTSLNRTFLAIPVKPAPQSGKKYYPNTPIKWATLANKNTEGQKPPPKQLLTIHLPRDVSE